LNVIIFLGGYFFVSHGLSPVMRAMLVDESSETLTKLGIQINDLMMSIYEVLWIYPMYIISFILNTLWYSDIAEQAYLVRGGKTPQRAFTLDRWVNAMAEEVYRLIMTLLFLVQRFVVAQIPYVGTFLGTVHWCWIYSLYSFEYKWVLEGWNLKQRLKYFERRWAYFIGFGLPPSILTLMFPQFVSDGFVAFLFPLFIVLAVVARPVAHVIPIVDKETGKKSVRYGRFAVFYYVKKLLDWLLRRLPSRSSAATATRPAATTGPKVTVEHRQHAD
jgi:etoposide-induced 2.4 mRNA